MAKRQFPLLVVTLLMALSAGVSSASLITNGGFEVSEPTTGPLPTTLGDWQGDNSQIVGAENGITPLQGSQMLRFLNSATGGPNATTTASEVFQLIDLSGFATAISKGVAVASLSTSFNRVSGDLETDTFFAIDILAYAGQPNSFPGQFGVSELGAVRAELLSDGDPATWEAVNASLLLPAGTDFLAVRLLADENIFNDGSNPEFDGHYADRAALRVAVVPEPAAALVWSLLGVFGIAGPSTRRLKNRLKKRPR